MEFQIQKNVFSKAIGLVGGVASTKASSLTILGNILIESEGAEKLRLVGTDLEVGISTTVECRVKEEGSITIPAKKLNDIIRELPEGEVLVTVAKNNAVNIKSGKAYFKIMGLGKEDYPKLPEWKEEDAYEMEQSLLKESLSLTAFAISADETRYVLNGILISIADTVVRFIATDGRRLAYVEKPFKNSKKNKLEIIIPTKAIHELSKILSWEGTVKLIPSQNQIIFDFGETHLISRLIEGNFPNYEQVIPKDKKTSSSMKRESLLQAVRRTALLTSSDSPAVKVDFVKGKVLVSSRSPNLGEAKEELEALTTGNDISIGFNPHYLSDALKHLDIDEVDIALTDSDKPGLITGKEGYKYVIMPMQLS